MSILRAVIAVSLLSAGACACGPEASAGLGDVALSPSSPDFGMVVCSPRALHACTGRWVMRGGVRVLGPVDVAPSASCATQASDAAAGCPGGPGDAARLRCLAERGVLLDVLATWGPDADPAERASRFTLRCDEGETAIDVIEPP